jgi:hypothetical protein
MQQRELQKLAAEKSKEEKIEQHKINKEVMPLYREINKEAAGAKEDDRRLNRMETLVNKGDLTRPRWHSFLNTLEHGFFGAGINLHSLESADSQEFDKLSKEFLKNAKNVFGTRITDTDVKTFLKMVPDLSQNREGKLAIIQNMRMYNDGKQIKKAAADQLVKQNGGKLPADFELKIEQLAGPQLDKLARRFATDARQKPQEETSMFDKITGGDILINPLDFVLGKG